ncbi:MAG TPA: methyltransferase domain-containing protein [Chthonomonadaceae bacterium]|nr:methyltransferase domain-containing protein [Chthonomonadaceae bacterium]
MPNSDPLPEAFLREVEALEPAYLRSDDPIVQSGFSGGAQRWRAERSPILDAIEAEGEILDVGCANGYLLECLVEWGQERGLTLTPYGMDIGPGLIEVARQRLPQWADHFFVGNSWDWEPPRTFRYVYALYDCAPESHFAEYVRRLLARMAAPGGRLIVGAYGSRSRQTPPFDIEGALQAAGFSIAGTSHGGDPILTRFAWIDKG